MKLNKFHILAVLLFSATVLQAREVSFTDSLGFKVHFRYGYRHVEPFYKDNYATLCDLRETIIMAELSGDLVSVSVKAYASPEGRSDYNDKLAMARASEMSRWIVNNCGIPKSKVSQHSGGVGWELLRNLALESDMYDRETVAGIIDNTDIWVRDYGGRIVTGRKKKLMDLYDGSVWREMQRKLFPEIRSSLSIVVTTSSSVTPPTNRLTSRPIHPLMIPLTSRAPLSLL